MESLLDRFCRYVRIDTQASEHTGTYPSSKGQLELGRILAAELRQIGLNDVSHDPNGLVYATIPGTCDAPVIAWVAHLDTSPESSGANVEPIVHRNYDGRDIILPGAAGKGIKVSENPELQALTGCTIITSNGTTLLGADDKAGVAVIVEAAERLVKKRDAKHGPIRLLFTCDEEIGHGVDHVDLARLGAVAAYTLDGGGAGEIDIETFSADLAIVTIEGINIHPSIGKGKMVNAVRLASTFVERMPRDLSPEATEKREGFMHPYHLDGGVARASLRILLRDFDTIRLSEYAERLRAIGRNLEREEPRCKVTVSVTEQYRNMAEGLGREPRAVAYAEDAMRAVGLTPKRGVIRGGTDGSRLTALGLPTPNLSTGEHNPHSPLEWTSLEEMEKAVLVLMALGERWGR
jgi:tripeptide aminopeptidase